jgi:hypothetical protein
MHILITVIIISCVQADETDRTKISSEQSASKSNRLELNLQHVDHYLGQLEPALRVFEEQLPALIDKWRIFDDPTPEDTLERLSDERDVLEKKIEELKVQIAELKQASKLKKEEPLAASIEQLENQLEKAEKEKAELDKKYNDLVRRIDGSSAQQKESKGCDVYKKFPKDKKPVYVLVYAGRVLPISQPYYSFRYCYIQENGRLVQVVEIKRVKDGEPITKAFESGGCLEKLLSDFDSQKQYIDFQVCKDSIAAFHLAIDEMRRLKISYTWAPQEDRTFFSRQGSSNGGGPNRRRGVDNTNSAN